MSLHGRVRPWDSNFEPRAKFTAPDHTDSRIRHLAQTKFSVQFKIYCRGWLRIGLGRYFKVGRNAWRRWRYLYQGVDSTKSPRWIYSKGHPYHLIHSQKLGRFRVLCDLMSVTKAILGLACGLISKYKDS